MNEHAMQTAPEAPFKHIDFLERAIDTERRPDGVVILRQRIALDPIQTSIPAYLRPTRRIRESIERLVQLYDAWGKPAEAVEWRQKLAAFEKTTNARDGGPVPEPENP